MDDEFPFEAPDQGYESTFHFEAKKDDANWISKWEKQFYIKVRGKYYGRIFVQIYAFWEPPPTGIVIKSFINPTGSRNLEYDPRQSISAENSFPPE